MTIMRVSLVGSALSDDEKGTLATRLIDAFAEVEVGAASEAVRSGFLVHFEELAKADLWNGARPMADVGPSGKAAVVTTQVMAGPWTDAMKAALFESIEAIVREATGMEKRGAGGDFWMTIVEVPEGAWGVGGRPVSIGQLAPLFADDRQERIRRYLEERSD